MSNQGGNTVPRITQAEHIGPNDTGDNIEAKRVANYAYNLDNNEWYRLTSSQDGRLLVETNGGTAHKKLIDDYTTPNITYIGEAQLGTATSDPHWRIQKIDETVGIAITWTGHGYNAVWDDRATEVYT